MGELWEDAFQEKEMMWGQKPTSLAINASELFKQSGFKKILIPGFGYGRNARPFYEKEFGGFGLIKAVEIEETGNGKSATRFWKVVCKRPENGN